VPCIKTYDLSYTNNGKDEFLTGDWKGFEMERRAICLQVRSPAKSDAIRISCAGSSK
jgi:hypothetical protein